MATASKFESSRFAGPETWRFLRSIGERQIAVTSTVPAFVDESVFGWLASRSLVRKRRRPAYALRGSGGQPSRAFMSEGW